MSILISAFVLLMAPLALIVTLIVLFAKRSSGKSADDFMKREGENMLKSIYTYIVLFATLMMTIGGSISIFMGAADYIAPQVYTETYEEYKRYHHVSTPYPDTGTAGEVDVTDEDELRESYELMKEEKIKAEKQNAIGHIVRSLGWVVIPFPIFLYFQRQRTKNG